MRHAAERIGSGAHGLDAARAVEWVRADPEYGALAAEMLLRAHSPESFGALAPAPPAHEVEQRDGEAERADDGADGRACDRGASEPCAADGVRRAMHQRS